MKIMVEDLRLNVLNMNIFDDLNVHSILIGYRFGFLYVCMRVNLDGSKPKIVYASHIILLAGGCKHKIKKSSL